VLAVADAPPGFHARRDARWKWYRYTIVLARRKRPLLRRTAWRLPDAPPLEDLAAATAPLAGRHDFRSFANVGSNPGSTVRTVHHIGWHRDGDLLRLDAVGDGFLYKMVRTLVGTALAAAMGSEPAAAVVRVLEARDRRAAGAPAPACGLCLMGVGVRGEVRPDGVPGNPGGAVDLGAQRPMGGSP
jgi:tRNA pseudouridine38-40 synthase